MFESDPKHGADRDRKLEELFQLAADLSESERANFYQRHCPDDDDLREELESLLRQDDEGTKDFLVSPFMSTDPPSTDGAGAEDTGLPSPGVSFMPERIGRYLIRERIGEGGMGSVYLAEQEQPVQRLVALKIVKPGMDTERVIQRFEMERQSLALMDHPGIARIFDGGATDGGRPYFVMEYAPGYPITRFCDRENLSVRERLELFCLVCEAVQHAHQKGIIHRDIKPTNVLVARTDGNIVPKVIDFGIARAITESSDEERGRTAASEVVGTCYYMSPEQAAPDGSTDTRSDIYSLGVLLYELLTGFLPFDTKTFRGKTAAEVQAILRDTDPLPPSTRVARLRSETGRNPDDDTTGTTDVYVAGRRQSDPESLVSRLSGDLDWITMRAMEKDPSRRYATAAGFAADVKRHLAHEAVLAGPPDVTYRLGKFIRRNRMTVVSGTLVVLALVAGVIGATWGMLSSSNQRDAALLARNKAEVAESEAGLLRREAERERLEAERLRAVAEEQRDDAVRSRVQAERAESDAEHQRNEAELQREAADSARVAEAKLREVAEAETSQAKLITDFLVDTLSLADSRVSLDPTPSLERMLLHAASEVETAFVGSPRSEATVRQVIGEALHSLGHLDAAEKHLQRALDVRLGLGGAIERSELYETTSRLAEVYSESDSRDAFELMRRACHLAIEVIGEEHGTIEHVLEYLIHNVINIDVEVARKRFNEIRGLTSTMLDEHDEHWLHIADVYAFLGHYLGYHWGSEDGIEYLEESLAIRRSELPVTHPRIASTLNELVTILNQHGRHDHAEALVTEALTIYESVLPEEHWLLAESRSLLGECLNGQGYFIAAEDLLLPAHDAIIGKLGSVSRAGINSTHRLLRHYESTGRPKQANDVRDALAEALAFARNAPWSWGKQAAVFRPEHAMLADALKSLDDLMMEGSRNFNEVNESYQWKIVSALEDVIALRHEHLPDEDPRSVIVARLLGEYSKIGVAQTYVLDRLMGEEMLRVLRPHQNQLTRTVASALQLLGSTALGDENDPERAEEYFGQAWELLTAKWSRHSRDAIRAQQQLSWALVAQERFEEAQYLIARTWEECWSELGPAHESTLRVLRNLRNFYDAWNRPTRFETYLEKHLRLPVDDETNARRLYLLAHSAVRSPGFSPKLYRFALRAARRAVELNPTSGEYTSAVGKALFRLERFDDARESLEHASALSGGMYVDDWPFLAMVYATEGDEAALNDALDQLSHVLEIKKPDADARRFVAEAEAMLAASPD